MNNYQLADLDKIKNDIYAIINNSERGVLISNFEAVKEVVEKIAQYIYDES